MFTQFLGPRLSPSQQSLGHIIAGLQRLNSLKSWSAAIRSAESGSKCLPVIALFHSPSLRHLPPRTESHIFSDVYAGKAWMRLEWETLGQVYAADSWYSDLSCFFYLSLLKVVTINCNLVSSAPSSKKHTVYLFPNALLLTFPFSELPESDGHQLPSWVFRMRLLQQDPSQLPLLPGGRTTLLWRRWFIFNCNSLISMKHLLREPRDITVVCYKFSRQCN